jgi:hypothetical protein
VTAPRDITRRIVLRAVTAVLPHRLDRAAAGDLDAVIELRVVYADRARPDRYALAIRGGRCVVEEAGAQEPGAVFTVGLRDLLRLGTGRARWQELLGSRRLQMAGDPFLALRFPVLFRLTRRRPRR